MKNIVLAFSVLLMSSFTDGTSSWNIKVNNTKVSPSANSLATESSLAIKKTDILNFNEATVYSGDTKTERHFVIIDAIGRKTLFSQVLKNSELNSINVNLSSILSPAEVSKLQGIEIIEVDVVANGLKSEKKIQTVQFKD